MRFILPLFICLSLLSCKKEEGKTINGTYQVVGSDDKGHSGSGTITLNDGSMGIDMPLVIGTLNDIQYSESNGILTVVRTSKYPKGDGVISDDNINLIIYVAYSGGVDRFVFNGSK